MKVVWTLLVAAVFIAQVISADNLENISDDQLVLTIKSEEFVIVLFGINKTRFLLEK